LRKGKSFFPYGFEYLDEVFSNYDIRGQKLAKVIKLFYIGNFKK
jgi:hypothetical protein